METHLMTAQPTWPSRRTDEDRSDPADDCDQGPVHAAIGEMAGLLLQTRGNMLTAGGLLGAIAIGIALEAGASARAAQSGEFRAVDLVLLLLLVACWLIAVTLLAVAGRPVLNALNRLRCGTGSPLDPRAGWLTVPQFGANSQEWTWGRAHLLVGAARLAWHRIMLADTWTCVTAACFLAWTAFTILG